MPELGCTVKNCSHNWEETCDRDRIRVDGRNACCCGETCCSSFEEAKDSGYKNAAGSAQMDTAVDCEARDCRYNEERRCTAGRIGIDGRNACECGQTECASFRAR
jgi:hypothetical protein